MGTVVQYQQRGTEDRNQPWGRFERAERCEQYRAVQAQGLSQRQAATGLEVPRSTRQAWQADQERLDACPAVGALLHSVPGLAFVHRLVLAIHLVCPEVGACGIRLGCLLLQITGLNRFVGASYGTQPQGNRRVEEASVAYRREESERLAREMPPKDITLTQDETCTGGLCLGRDRTCEHLHCVGASGTDTGARPLACPDGTGPCGSQLSGDALDEG